MHERLTTVPVLTALAALAALAVPVAAVMAATASAQTAQIERGRYLAIAADCGACHDDAEHKAPFAGGRPIPTPFGRLLAPNITPDRDSGIGSWSDAQFDAALRLGRMPDGKRLYPAMPFCYYTRMSLADVLAIRAYLNTVEPVRHAVNPNQLPFPLNLRWLMRLWDALYFEPGELKPDVSQSAAWNRGAYLVEGPGHCGACHTPKTVLGGDKSSQAFHGYSIQGWFGPDITNDRQRGLANWSNADVVDYLKKGHNRLAAASGPMGEEVADSSSHLSSPDLEAIATYLKQRAGGDDEQRPVAPGDPMMVAGAAIYDDLCSACHRPDGTGVGFLIPNLAASSAVASREPTSVLHVVLRGAVSVATDEEPTAPAMPGFATQLSDAQIAAVATYVRNSWGHAASRLSEHQVSVARTDLHAGTP
jgi:mono/diheme cytochrome c family protein